MSDSRVPLPPPDFPWRADLDCSGAGPGARECVHRACAGGNLGGGGAGGV